MPREGGCGAGSSGMRMMNRAMANRIKGHLQCPQSNYHSVTLSNGKILSATSRARNRRK